MTIPRRILRDYPSGCQGKERFASPAEAAKAVVRRKGAVSAYKCAYCKSWHLTRQAKK